jgi:hypothetical protein
MVNWNVNGLGDKEARLQKFQTMLNENPDMCFLTETHATEEKIQGYIQEWKDMGGTGAYFGKAPSSAEQGVAILFGKKFAPTPSNIKESSPGRSLSMEIDLGKKKHTLLATYAPTIPASRSQFFDDITTNETTRNQVVWSGDFNCVEDGNLDRIGPVKNHHLRGAVQIRRYKDIHKLVDPYRIQFPEGRECTFKATNTVNNIQSRLDRFYLPNKNTHHFHTKIVHTVPLSDHDMVVTKFKPIGMLNRGLPSWKFNTKLLEENEYLVQLEAILRDLIARENQFPHIFDFWETIKGRIKIFSIHFGAEKKKRDNEVLEAAERNLAAFEAQENPDEYTLRDLRLGIGNLRKTSVDLLLLQNKLDAIEFDEQPSLYFYKRLENRREKSTLEELLNDKNELITDQKGVLEEAKKFYTNLYKDEPVDVMAQDEILQKIDKNISAANFQRLERDLTVPELKYALGKMKNNKTPGTDGIPSELYKQFQELLLPILLRVSKECELLNRMPQTQRDALIALLYKDKGEKKDLANWRPISLLNVDYKIITKALANKLQEALVDIINPNQTAGIPGRSINNNLWALRDLLDHSNENNIPIIILLLDQKKAFDMVNHAFLFKTMEKFGFGPKFINWIKTLYVDCSAYIQNNNFLSGKINIQRGVRQGCPISCYLYILVAETLAQAIRSDDQIHGYPLPLVGSDPLKVAQFADDTQGVILYEKDPLQQTDHTRTSIVHFMECLKLYEKASGSRLNLRKTQIFISGGLRLDADTTNLSTAREVNAKYHDILPAKAKSIDEGMYTLGIWFYSMPALRFQKNFNILKQKMIKKINFLQTRRLSIKGRAIAVNTRALSKLWYIASVLPITRGNANRTPFLEHKALHTELKQVISSYVWQNDYIPPVKGHTLNLSFKKGGLGILQIDIQGLALRAKQISEALTNKPNPLPSQIFARYYLCDLNGKERPARRPFFPYTQFLEQYRRDRRRGANGNPVAYPISQNYSSMIEIAIAKKHIYNDPDNFPTCKKTYKSIFPPEFIIAGEAKWMERLLRKPDWSNTWEILNNSTTKENFWKMRHFCLHSVDRIDSFSEKKEPVVRRECYYCSDVLGDQNSPDDTHIHTFYDCPLAVGVWEEVLQTLYKINHSGITPLIPQNKKVLIIGIAGKGKHDTIANTIIAETINQLWKAHYKLVHNQVFPDEQTCIAAINATVKIALNDHLQVALRGPGLGVFTAKYHIPGLFDINRTGDGLIFYF